MPDALKNAPAGRYSVEQRIGVLEELLSERFSCRAFRPDPVSRPTIERILMTAQKTASWCNSQPWQLAIASGTATRKFRDVIYAAASRRQTEHRRFSISPRISRRVSGAAARE